MLPAILIGPRSALAIALTLPLGAFLAGALDTASCIFACTSAVAAAYTIRGAERRMDLVKAGLVIGAVNCVAAVAVKLNHCCSSEEARLPFAQVLAVSDAAPPGGTILSLIPIR